MNLTKCIGAFRFFLIEEQEGLREPVDGILGLARSNKSKLSKGYVISDQHFYLLQMHEQR